MTIVNVAFPSIRAAFPGTSICDLSWVLNAYNIVLRRLPGRLRPACGPDRPPPGVYTSGLLLFTCSRPSVCAAAGSVLGFLLGARVGPGPRRRASSSPPPSPWSSRRSPVIAPLARRRALGRVSAALASGLGPPIGGALVECGWLALGVPRQRPDRPRSPCVAAPPVCSSRAAAPGRRRMPDLEGALALGRRAGPAHRWASSTATTGAGPSCLTLGCSACRRRGLLLAWLRRQLPDRIRSPLVDPAAAPGPIGLRGRQPRVDHRWHGVLRLSADEHPVAAVRLGLLRSCAPASPSCPAALVAAVLAAVLGPVAQQRGYRSGHHPGCPGVGARATSGTRAGWGPPPTSSDSGCPGSCSAGSGSAPPCRSWVAPRWPPCPADGYATASAVSSSARQIGAVLGIALLVVIIGDADPDSRRSPTFRHGWVFSSACFLAVAVDRRLHRSGTRAQHVGTHERDELRAERAWCCQNRYRSAPRRRRPNGPSPLAAAPLFQPVCRCAHAPELEDGGRCRFDDPRGRVACSASRRPRPGRSTSSSPVGWTSSSDGAAVATARRPGPCSASSPC